MAEEYDEINASTSKNLNPNDNEFLKVPQKVSHLKEHNAATQIPPHASAALNQYMESKRNG